MSGWFIRLTRCCPCCPPPLLLPPLCPAACHSAVPSAAADAAAAAVAAGWLKAVTVPNQHIVSLIDNCFLLFFTTRCRWMLKNDITDVLDLTFAEGEPGCSLLHTAVISGCAASAHLGSEAGAALLASSVVAA